MNTKVSGIKKRIERLRAEISHHNMLYFAEDAPQINDAQYDQLKQELLTLEMQYPQLQSMDSPTNLVGAPVSSKFKKIAHLRPMLSLDNIFTIEDLEDFLQRVIKFLRYQGEIEIYAEPKIDGLSFSAIYAQGKLISCATRGDGQVGEDITANIQQIDNFPKNISTSETVSTLR